MDRNKILKIITGNPILKASRETGVKPIELMKFYNNLESLLKTDISYSDIGEKMVLLLVLTTTERECDAQLNIFERKTMDSALKTGLLDKGNILFVNYEGKLIKVIEGQFINDYIQATNFSKEDKSIVFFIERMAIHFIVKGEPIYYIHDILQSYRPGVRNPKSLPAREYKQLIKNQHDAVVYKERGIKYWANKAHRVLVDNPEVHFHKPLWWYLDQHIPDAQVDSGATIAGTEDRTDIRILSFESRELYIIEIKCLGKTKSKIERSDDWANQGLIQINQYLEDEMKSTKGTLVLYDGRKQDKHIVWCTDIKCSPKYDNNPMRFYLESESASVKAKKTFSKLKKRS